MLMVKSVKPTKTTGRWQWIIVDRTVNGDTVKHGGLANTHNQAESDAIRALKKMQRSNTYRDDNDMWIDGE